MSKKVADILSLYKSPDLYQARIGHFFCGPAALAISLALIEKRQTSIMSAERGHGREVTYLCQTSLTHEPREKCS